MREIFSWPFWLGLLIGWLLMGNVVNMVRGSLARRSG